MNENLTAAGGYSGAALGEAADARSVGECPAGMLRGTNECAAQQASSTDRHRTISTTVDVPAIYGFDAALRNLKQGQRITRAGWNGRGQYVEMQRPDKHSRMTAPYAVLRNNFGDLVPWVPSQGDLFANDWALLPS